MLEAGGDMSAHISAHVAIQAAVGIVGRQKEEVQYVLLGAQSLAG